MKILVFITHYKGTLRGAQLLTLRFVDSLRSLGHTVDLVDLATLNNIGMSLEEMRTLCNYQLVIASLGTSAFDECERKPMFDLQPPYIVFNHSIVELPLCIKHFRDRNSFYLVPSKAAQIVDYSQVFNPKIDIEKFAYFDRSRRNTSRVGFVSGLDSKLRDFTEELKRYGNPIIVGNGACETKWRKEAPEFEWTGEQSDVIPYLQQMDVFIYPTKLESFGMSIAEAASTGLPIVAFNCGGVTETVHNGVNGYLVDTWEEFHEKVDKLLADKKLRLEMGKKSREIVEKKFDIRDLDDAWEKVLNELMPEVSVVITTHNRPKKVLDAIRSVMNQTYPCNLIVINDVSNTEKSDYTKAKIVVDNFIETDKNVGTSVARNTGIKEVKNRFPRTKYLAFLDDDDVYSPIAIQELVKGLIANPSYRAAYGKMVMEQDNGYRTPMPLYVPYSFEALCRRTIMSPSCLLWDIKLFDEFGGYDEEMQKGKFECGPEDTELQIRFAKAGVQYLFVDKTVTRYAQPNSSCNTVRGINSGDMKRGIQYIEEKLGVTLDYGVGLH